MLNLVLGGGGACDQPMYRAAHFAPAKNKTTKHKQWL